MHQLAADGIAVLIPPDSGLRKTPRPGWNGGYFSFMRTSFRPSMAPASTSNAST